MTDVPALLFVLASLFSYQQGYNNKQLRFFILGSVLAFLGFYTRQTAVLPWLAALLSVPNLESARRPRILMLGFFVPLIASVLLYLLLGRQGLLPESTTATHFLPDTMQTLTHAFSWLWYTLIYLGLLSIPLTAPLLPSAIREKRFWLLLGAGFTIVLAFLLKKHELLPYTGNILTAYGIGPNTTVLRGVMTPLSRHRPESSSPSSGSWALRSSRSS